MSTDGPTTQRVPVPGRGRDDLPGLPSTAGDVLRGPGGGPAPGPSEDEGSALARAASLRFPRLKELAPRERVDALIDYISETAIARGDLEELRLTSHINLREARAALSLTPTGVSGRQREDAKRASRPDLAAQVDGAQWLVDRCKEQIGRLDRDYDAASRAYTLLSGS